MRSLLWRSAGRALAILAVFAALPTHAETDTSGTLDEVVVTAARRQLIGTTSTASEGIVVSVDGIPINNPTHAHGQGYTDLNFMIPELATNIKYTKGTYYADQGDFASVGSIHLSYLDRIADEATVTVGTLGFQRVFTAGSFSAAGCSVLGALT